MSDTKAAVPTTASISVSPRAAMATPARPREESRGWLALILQLIGFSAAAAIGFAASLYYTTQQQAAAARQRQAADERIATAATQAAPAENVPAETQSAEQPAASEAAAPEGQFSEEVERAEMIEAQQAKPPVPLENVPTEPTTTSIEGLPFDRLEPADSDLKVETLDGQTVTEPDAAITP
ncbi:MAG: hypothetical protein KF708_03020 [Pirellulales bacterium]|nr:hypothetical protein [Pirellulales bacterium]